eukprot:25739-Eustigmatos_ZCMA.PRE.1
MGDHFLSILLPITVEDADRCMIYPFVAAQDVREIYEFEDDKPPLGQGSYGIVIKATHKQTRQAFACKILYVNRA